MSDLLEWQALGNKLRKLVEIAWSNGYREMMDWTFEPIGKESGEPWIFNGHGVYENHPSWDEDARSLQLNSIIFDHEFIKALCKAKWGDSIYKQIDINDPTGWFESTPIVASAMPEYTLMQLAISRNRIDYLWSMFGEEK